MDNSKIQSYYDDFIERQRKMGVNARHKSIFEKCVTAGLKPEHSVLEIGSGIGTFTSLIIPYIKKGEIVAMDISVKSIDIAKEDYSAENAQFIAGDVTKFDFGPQTFDVIILPDVLEHIPIELHRQLFTKLSQILSKDGFIFINIPNPYYLQWCHETRPDTLQVIDQPIYTNELLENIKDTDLIISELKSYSIWIEDNDYQYIVMKNQKSFDFSKEIIHTPKLSKRIREKVSLILKGTKQK